MTVFKTSLPRSEAYWGITKKSDIMDKHYLVFFAFGFALVPA